MKIRLRTKEVYGHKKYYPECDTSRLLCNLCGQKSFTAKNLDIIRQLGYQIDNVTVALSI